MAVDRDGNVTSGAFEALRMLLLCLITVALAAFLIYAVNRVGDLNLQALRSVPDESTVLRQQASTFGKLAWVAFLAAVASLLVTVSWVTS